MDLKRKKKNKIQTQIEQVMDLERTKKKKYKMRVNESRPWLGSLNESERDIKNLHERERECGSVVLVLF